MLRVGGVDLTSVAADFGTPTFVLDVEAMRGRARVWASAMAEEFWDGYGMNGGDAFYAGKAFLSADVARLVVAEGLGIDTASLGELSLALRAGVDPDAHRPARQQQVGRGDPPRPRGRHPPHLHRLDGRGSPDRAHRR